MKNIVITGASSFVGYHLAKHFSNVGNVIATITKPISEYEAIRKKRLELLSSKVILAHLDISAPEQLKDFIKTHKPELWIHHAGYVQNYASPDYDLKDANRINVDPLFTLVPLLKEFACKKLLVSGSSMEYADSDLKHSEEENGLPSFPYGASKLLETQESLRLASKVGLSTTVIRIFNPFGLFDTPAKLFPFLVTQLLSQKKVELSPCLQVRNFVHVETLCDIYDFFAHKTESEIVNACPHEGIVLAEFLKKLAGELKVNSTLLDFGKKQMREGEPMICDASNKKLYARGFLPKYSLDDEIKKYADEITQNKELFL